MSALATQKRLQAEDFFALPEPLDGSKRELIRGEVTTMPAPGLEHGEIQVNVAFLIKTFLKTNRIGRVFTESGTITERDPDTVRGPDVSYYSRERLPLEQRVVKYHTQSPDLCVEVLSPSNTTRQIDAKLREYFFADVREVWVIDPEYRNITIFREPLEGRLYKDGATFVGGEVLPGFTCPVAELFG